MNKTLIAAGLMLIVGLLGIGGYYLASGYLQKQDQVKGSDAKVGKTIRIAGDGYLGYWFINSPEMKRQAARRGFSVQYTNDGGAYSERLQKFSTGQYDAIVLPINSYLTHGAGYNYPGVITSSIAESRGADALLCFENKLPTGKIKDLNDASLKIVYTGESPSSFLLDLTIVDFDLFNLTKTDEWRVEVAGSAEVLVRAKRHEGDCFVMWEPEVSQALREVPDLKRVWGSDSFSGYIDDVFVFDRNFVSRSQDDVVSFYEAYFSTMRAYASDRSKLVQDMSRTTGLAPADIQPMLDGIDWHDLSENLARQYGINTGAGGRAVEGIFNTIVASIDVMLRTGRLSSDPLGDPYRIINTAVIKQVQANLPETLGQNGQARSFAQLGDAEWSKLRHVGMMRDERVTFTLGTAKLDAAGEATVDKIANLLQVNYPDYRIVVEGHTAVGSSEAEGIKLSKERAEAVVQRLIAVHNISPARFKTVGKGSAEPPEMKPGENARELRYRIPRVEIELYMDNTF